MMKLSNLICLSTLLLPSWTLSAEDVELSRTQLGSYTLSTPTRISVHDPSIFLDTVSNKNSVIYYLLGSHLGMGRYTALRTNGKLGNPTLVTTVSESSNTFFSNASGAQVNCDYAYGSPAVTRVKNYLGEEVDMPAFDAHVWQNSGYTVRGNQWAPDVVYNPTMKKWLMYMSLNGDTWCSSIVCFSSDNPKGPYRYQGLVVCSGFSGHYKHNGYVAADDWKQTDLQIATGCTALPARYQAYKENKAGYYGTFWPNCIDPCVFYDEEGRLMMSYGSWSGGIWMIELDENTGLRDYTVTYPYQVKGADATPGDPNANCTSDPYFGRKIAGGWYDSGEGSYIEHVGGYYHLFISYGGFAPDGGYEMRVFRSEKPEGPYVDAKGQSAIQLDKYEMNYGTSATFNRGVKIMGGYQWGFMPTAELSQGHNSLLTDPWGRTLLCYHTKFNDGTIGHSVRLHQLFQNQDGWLVAAPFEFHNETATQQSIASKESISNEEIPGQYQWLQHNYKVDYAKMSYVQPKEITLSASADDPTSGTITGAVTGTWHRVPGTDYIEIKAFGIVHKGVLVRQTIDYSNISTLCFTCVASDGDGVSGTTGQRSIWGSKANYKQAIKYTLDQLDIPSALTSSQRIQENLTLPTQGKLGARVAWRSSDTSILNHTGTVRGDGEVTLTLTISKDGYAYVERYTLQVGEETGIGEVCTEERKEVRLYDLLGRPAGNARRGVYVKAGR